METHASIIPFMTQGKAFRGLMRMLNRAKLVKIYMYTRTWSHIISHTYKIMKNLCCCESVAHSNINGEGDDRDEDWSCGPEVHT